MHKSLQVTSKAQMEEQQLHRAQNQPATEKQAGGLRVGEGMGSTVRFCASCSGRRTQPHP